MALLRSLKSKKDAQRFHASRIHKASSAESILAHVLRQRGWSKLWREGRLTDRRRLRLLEDIRQYGRAWLRHEAEAFFGAHGIDTARTISDQIVPSLKRWFSRMRQFVRELIIAGSTALLGRDLVAQEATQANELADVQDRYFNGFERELTVNPPQALQEPTGQIPGPEPVKPMSPAQAAARAAMYADSTHQAAQRIQRSTIRRNGSAKWERLVMGHPKTEHCSECPPDAALGWVPFGTLRPIGDRECENLCLCHFEYSDSIDIPAVAKPGGPKRQPKLALKGSQEAIDKLLANPEFNEAVERLKLVMTIHVGERD